MPGTTPRGYPYPLPTEPVAEGAQAIRNLAEKIEATAAMDLIQTITLSAPGQFNFTSIPQTYTDLELRILGRGAGTGGSGAPYILGRINDIATATMSNQLWSAYQTTTTASESNAAVWLYLGLLPDSTINGNCWAQMTARFFDYHGAGFRAFHSEGTAHAPAAAGRRFVHSGALQSVAGTAITKLTLFTSDATFNYATGSRASLYGIR